MRPNVTTFFALGGKDSLRVANLSGGGALCSEWEVDAEGTGGTFWDEYGAGPSVNGWISWTQRLWPPCKLSMRLRHWQMNPSMNRFHGVRGFPEGWLGALLSYHVWSRVWRAFPVHWPFWVLRLRSLESFSESVPCTSRVPMCFASNYSKTITEDSSESWNWSSIGLDCGWNRDGIKAPTTSEPRCKPWKGLSRGSPAHLGAAAYLNWQVCTPQSKRERVGEEE